MINLCTQRCGRASRDEGPRRVTAHSAEANKQFCSNAVTNTKYRWWNFVAKNLWIQFGSFETGYFLFIAILQLFPAITPVSPLTTWGPLILVMAITAAKDLADDIARWRADVAYNTRPVSVVRDGAVCKVKASQVRVGDFLLIMCDEEICCDAMLLACAERSGKALIQTTNLDGETNLKTRTALLATRHIAYAIAEQRREEEPTIADVCVGVSSSSIEWVECSAPNDRIYEWDARVKLRSEPNAVAASAAQMLLQTTRLRNTEWAVGIAVYTGNETKFGKNKKVPPPKKTQTDRMISHFSLAIFCFQLCLVTVLGTAGGIMQLTALKGKAWYLSLPSTDMWYEWIIIPARFLLLNSTMIPISLKVTMDLAKLLMALFIDLDIEMWDPGDVITSCGFGRFACCTRSRRAQSTSIAEDLGQVQYILSDKTGTLTNNEMVLRRIVCDDMVSDRMLVYGNPVEHRVPASRVRRRSVQDEGGRAAAVSAADSSSGDGAIASASGGVGSSSSGTMAIDAMGIGAVHETRNPLQVLGKRLSEALWSAAEPEDDAVSDAAPLDGSISEAQCHPLVENVRSLHIGGIPEGTPVEVSTSARHASPDRGVASRLHSAWRCAKVLQAHMYEDQLEYDVKHDEGSMMPSAVTAQFDELLSGESQAAARRADKLQHMLRAMVLNHEVTIAPCADEAGAAAGKKKAAEQGSMWLDHNFIYRGSSPDEIALVEGAAACGSVLVESTDTRIKIRLPQRRRGAVGVDLFETYRVLAILEFSSDRKRMSIVVRGPLMNHGSEDGDAGIHLFIKGADNKVFERTHGAEAAKVEGYRKELEVFAMQGLRTLVYGYRRVGEEEWVAWKARLAAASLALENRQEAKEECYEELEKDVFICGATAIEDRLQDGVSDTMRALQAVGIKCWMLTGDKVTTAIEIAIMSHMHRRGDPLFCITCDDAEKLATNDTASARVGRLIDACAEKLHSALPADLKSSEDLTNGERRFTMCLDGVAVQHALADHEEAFQALCLEVPTVLCCRVTPKQKAAIVALMKKSGHITLSIGDGGNDVPMIQEAHVGVGIRGKEGTQAANAADFVLGRFRFLKRLVLLHGYWSYSRSALIAQYSFYKSLTFCFIQIGFAFFSGFSGASLFNSLCVGSCNAVVFWSVICFVFDRAETERALLLPPESPEFIKHYKDGQTSKKMNPFGFLLKWFLRAIFHGVILSLLYIASDSILDTRGTDSPVGGPEAGSGYQSAGLITFFAWLWVQDFTMLSELRTPTILNLGVTAFSHVLFVVGILLIQVVPLEVSQSQVDFMSVTNVLGSPMVWVASLWAVFACIAPVELAKLCGTCLERNAEDVEGVNTMIAGFERAHAVGMLNPLDEALMDGDSLTRASMSTDGDDESRDSVFTAWSNRFSFVGTKAKGLLSPGRTTPSTDADKLDGFAPPEEGVQMRSMQSKGERISMAYDES